MEWKRVGPLLESLLFNAEFIIFGHRGALRLFNIPGLGLIKRGEKKSERHRSVNTRALQELLTEPSEAKGVVEIFSGY